MTLFRLKQITTHITLAVLVATSAALSSGVFAQTITVEDAYQIEGSESSSSEQDFLFFVDISGTIDSPITLTWSTLDIDAQANSDYEAITDGELVLMPGDEKLKGDYRRKIAVKVFNDDSFEGDESFVVMVSTDSNLVTISNEGGIAIGRILDEDGTYVSFKSFKGFENVIFFELSFDPPLRFQKTSDQSDRYSRELPFTILKNSDITFVDWSAWNSGREQELKIQVNGSNLDTEYNEQNLGVESFGPIATTYVGDRGQIAFEIEGNDFFQADTRRGYLPATSLGTSCATKISCKVSLGIFRPYSAKNEKYWIIWGGIAKVIWVILGVIGIGVAIYLSYLTRKNETGNADRIVGAFKALNWKSSNTIRTPTKKFNRAIQTSPEKLSGEIQALPEKIVTPLSSGIQSSSEKISSEIQSLPEKIVTPLSSAIQSYTKDIVGAFEKLGGQNQTAISTSPDPKELPATENNFEKNNSTDAIERRMVKVEDIAKEFENSKGSYWHENVQPLDNGDTLSAKIVSGIPDDFNSRQNLNQLTSKIESMTGLDEIHGVLICKDSTIVKNDQISKISPVQMDQSEYDTYRELFGNNINENSPCAIFMFHEQTEDHAAKDFK